MEKYFFVLGRYPSLSVAEIQAVLKHQKVNFTVDNCSSEILTVSVSSQTSLSQLMETLGGTVKIGQILGEVSYIEDQSHFLKFLEARFLKEKVLPQNLNKIHFAISIYDGGAGREITEKIESNQLLFYKSLKENLESSGIKTGFLRIKGRYVSSVSVFKNRLLTKGFELVLIITKDNIILGKTSVVQDFNSFSKRDMERPKKDKRSGILPVKLARMMVNLSQPGQNSILVDPFCGSGTILTEAALLGVKNLIGTDIKPEAISNSRSNFDWIIREYYLNKNNFDLKLQSADIKELNNILGQNMADIIVTEPYLGPPLISKPATNKAQNIIADLIPLYKLSFQVISRLLKKDGRLIIILPIIHSIREDFQVDLDKILPSNLKVIPPLTGLPENTYIRASSRNSLVYQSQGQFISREIFSFVKS